MKPEFWHQRWRRNEIGFHQDDFNAHLQAHWGRLGLGEGALVFVPLCGKSRDLLWLAGQGCRLLGVEISPLAVESFFRENGLNPRVVEQGPFERYQQDELSILCGDFFDLGVGDLAEVTGVYDRASLIALPPAMRSAYAEHLDRVLPTAATQLLITLEYPDGEMQGPPFSVPEEEVRTLYGQRWTVETVSAMDVLGENPRFRERGLTRLEEKVFRLVSQGRT